MTSQRLILKVHCTLSANQKRDQCIVIIQSVAFYAKLGAVWYLQIKDHIASLNSFQLTVAEWKKDLMGTRIQFEKTNLLLNLLYVAVSPLEKSDVIRVYLRHA